MRAVRTAIIGLSLCVACSTDGSVLEPRDGGGSLDGSTLRPPPMGDPPPRFGPPPGTPPGTPTGIYYDIVYVRSPRLGDDELARLPEVKDPIHVMPGTDLMLLHPDGTEEVLVAGGDGAVVDPYPSFDGQWIYYAQFPDTRDLNTQRGDIPRAGADIYRIHVGSREIVRLTHQEWTPNTAAGEWSDDPIEGGPDENRLGYGVFNLGPTPLAGGRVMFTSSRNGFLPNKSFTNPNLQLYVMDEDGQNVELVGHMNLGSALHPTALADGRVMFSSYEAQGVRDRRIWGLWSIWPDGREWEPLMSAFESPKAFHFQTQLSDGHLVFEEYYNQNNNAFGTLLRMPAWPPAEGPMFGSPRPQDNPRLQQGWHSDGQPRYQQYSFPPQGLSVLTPFAWSHDEASARLPDSGEYAGKVTTPAAAPHNQLLLSYTGGPANNLNRPTPMPYYDAGIYIADGAGEIAHPDQLTLVLDHPEYNELYPRPVVPYRDLYGVEEPFQLAFLPNDGARHERLPAGTPFGIVGTSSFYNRDTTPGTGVAEYDGLDPFNTSQNGASSNWVAQGADAGLYDNSEIFAVRVLSMEPTSFRSYGPASNQGQGRAWRNHANERLRILGEVPLRHRDESGAVVIDSDGNPDTSFTALIPADVPFTFQTLDENGLVLNMSQTWHQVRPGEVRVNCGGCHGHSREGTPFEGTYASTAAWQPPDLARTTPMLTREGDRTTVRVVEAGAVDVEFFRDIRPILDRSCVSCHNADRAEGNLNLADDALADGWSGTWSRLADDRDAEHGYPPVITNGTWRQTNASRYVRQFQARRSLLIWKLFGRRLDGWTNDDHPTETVPGDASTLPDGANPNLADIDYTGTIMPPPDSGVPPLTDDERMLFARWVDLGCPISRQDEPYARYGWHLDELRPTLTISSPAQRLSREPIRALRFAAFDYYSGLDESSLSITADFEVGGRPPGAELVDLFAQEDYVWTYALPEPISDRAERRLTVRVRDHAGNVTEQVRTFRVD